MGSKKQLHKNFFFQRRFTICNCPSDSLCLIWLRSISWYSLVYCRIWERLLHQGVDHMHGWNSQGRLEWIRKNKQHYEHSPFVRLCLSSGEQRALEAAHAPTRIFAAGIHAIFTKKRLNSPFCHGVEFGRQSGP